MGTPVRILEREMQCVGAGKCESRPMTEEEKIKYGIKSKEANEVMKGVKITPPDREKLVKVLAKVEGKTKSIYHACKAFKVSSQTIYNWIKQYGIEFDAEGRVICECKPETQEQAPQTIGESINDDTKTIQAEAIIRQGDIVLKGPDKVTITDFQTIEGLNNNQETTKLTHRVGYAEYDIGNAVVQIDYRQGLVKIGKISNDSLPTEEPISIEEAIAAAELILDVFGNE